MARRRFTPAEIASFRVAVAKGASVTDLGREHGFSTATYRRWARTYGTPFFPYTPIEEDRRLASAWGTERTLTGAWKRYRSFAEDDRWSLEAELLNYVRRLSRTERLVTGAGPGDPRGPLRHGIGFGLPTLRRSSNATPPTEK